MEEDARDPRRSEPAPQQDLPRVEATLLSVWRRTIVEGGGPRLTLAEAAALLGSSVESVRRRIKAGQIRAYRDVKGRIRVNASVTYNPEDEQSASNDGQTVTRLWEELKALRARLEASQADNERLTNELQAAENALEYTKIELANLWRAMTTRSKRQSQGEQVYRAGVLDFAQERSRIQDKITNIRALAKRRKWRWLQTG